MSLFNKISKILFIHLFIFSLGISQEVVEYFNYTGNVQSINLPPCVNIVLDL